ncbi:hypothetical protein B0H13DRAFT_2372436 [Mycena leptocephala]|nr:hypothetical protein B0H13DRAFT_2372436 [Mycena leptocephala]
MTSPLVAWLPILPMDPKLSPAPPCSFNGAHTVYDPDLHPPTYYREFPSDSDPTAPIPVPMKRKGGKATKGEPS